MAPKRRKLSQPTSKTQGTSSRNGISQPNIDVMFNEISMNGVSDTDEVVNDCVRYFIYKAGQHLPFRKGEILKQFKGSIGKGFYNIIEKAATILENVYGYKLILCEGNNNCYIVSNNLPHIEEDVQTTVLPEDRRKVLLMLVLTHVYLTTTVVNQVSLFSFLRSLHIEPERKHEIFGNVKEYIMVTLVKQQYLNSEKDSISEDTTFSWGPRAEKEISKHDILKFVCKIYKNQNPKSWRTQHKEAEEQPIENNRNQILGAGENGIDG